MNITKIGQACIVVEEQGVKVLVDPGSYTTAQDELTGVDAIVITHEHGDHMGIDSIKKILANNPGAVVIANASVGAALEKEGIAYTKVADGEQAEVKGLIIKGAGKEHATICDGFGLCENTGYFIGPRLFHPGDALYNPGIPVEILALPTGGPWMKIGEAIDYARAVHPRTAFPIHDFMYKPGMSMGDRLGDMFLKSSGIDYVLMKEGDTKEF